MASFSRAALGMNFGKIIQQVNVMREFLSPTSVKVLVPGGFPYEAFNGKAFIHPWSIIRMVESTRAAMFNKAVGGHNFLNVAEIYEDYLLFNASTSTHIFPELYNPSTVKGPLEINIKLDYVGNMTFKLCTAIHIGGNPSPVCENETQTVFVSNKTRLPCAPPQWWKEKYSLGQENGEPLKLDRLTLPDDVKYSDYHFRIPASDVDPYMHVNWSNFVKYCHDAYVYTEFKKSGMQGAGNALRNMKHFSVSYIKEGNIGDNVNVRYWASCDNLNIFHFQLLKDSNLLGECSVEYYL